MDRRYKHLNSEERGVIFAEHRRGASLRAIGSLLGRSPSTIGRESVHADWILRNEETIAGLSGWAVEVENFFRVIAQHDPERIMRICSVSKNGSITAEHFVGFNEHFTIAQVLMDLSENEDCNLMFDPIPWVQGKRPRKTRFGFRTVTVGHPFDYYPSPSIFWSIGSSAYQTPNWQRRVNHVRRGSGSRAQKLKARLEGS